MDNPKTLATLGTQHTRLRQAKQYNTTQKTLTDPTKKPGMNPGDC